MIWWWWILLGLVLLVIELASPGGLVALFFGVSAIVVGVLSGAGILTPWWLQWTLFSVIAVAALAGLRRPLKARLNIDGAGKPIDSLTGELGVILEPIAPGGIGKVEVRGSSWSARTTEPAVLERGRRCAVVRVEGLTLWVRPE